MFERICIYCECPYSYYSNKEHAYRKSCNASLNGYHKFKVKIIYYANIFFKFLKSKFKIN